MEWQTFLQWFFITASSASIFGGWLAWASRKNGKETRDLMKQLHQESQNILTSLEKTAEKRHQEVLIQHQDIVELLKRGFGGAGN